jgi:hypothetical protein
VECRFASCGLRSRCSSVRTEACGLPGISGCENDGRSLGGKEERGFVSGHYFGARWGKVYEFRLSNEAKWLEWRDLHATKESSVRNFRREYVVIQSVPLPVTWELSVLIN